MKQYRFYVTDPDNPDDVIHKHFKTLSDFAIWSQALEAFCDFIEGEYGYSIRENIKLRKSIFSDQHSFDTWDDDEEEEWDWGDEYEDNEDDVEIDPELWGTLGVSE